VPVDVVTTIEIDRKRDDVAAYAVDPDHATVWYKNIESSSWETGPPLVVGSRMVFRARFMGKTLCYTYQVLEFVPSVRFVMSTAQGPFPMETTYAWSDSATGGTVMELRNRGEPTGFSKAMSFLMAPAMRRANAKDLARLKAILESQH
jgi:Polyketide cyclase / dehydrase and lipid transport